MNLDLVIRRGDKTSEHKVRIPTLPGQGASAGQGDIEIDGKTFPVDWCEVSPGAYSIVIGQRSFEAQAVPPPPEGLSSDVRWLITVGDEEFLIEIRDSRTRRHARPAGSAEGPQEIKAPMPGRIVKILVEKGQEVHEGQGLLVIEAMKMQNELCAPRSGHVDHIDVTEGMGIEAGAPLLRIV